MNRKIFFFRQACTPRKKPWIWNIYFDGEEYSFVESSWDLKDNKKSKS